LTTDSFDAGVTVRPTHLRADALLFGACLGYWYHFKRECLSGFVTRHLQVIYLVSLFLIMPAFFIPLETRVMVSAGFTCQYLGWGGLMLWSLHVRLEVPRWLTRAGSLTGIVGYYSYSIYLWHMASRYWVCNSIARLLGLDGNGFYIGFVLYLTVSILGGVAMAKLIELPALRLRDRLCPRDQEPTHWNSAAIRSAGVRAGANRP